MKPILPILLRTGSSIFPAVAAAMIAASADAQTTWNAAVDGHWSLGANWQGGVPDRSIPAAKDAAIIATGGNYTVTYDATDVAGFKPFGALTIGNTNPNTTTASIGASGFSYNGDLNVNSGGILEVQSSGVLTQTAGSSLVKTGGAFIVRSGGTATVRASTAYNTGAISVESGGTLKVSTENLGIGPGGSVNNAGALTMQTDRVLNVIGGSLTNSGAISWVPSLVAQNNLSIGNGTDSSMLMTGGSMINPVGLWDRGVLIAAAPATGNSALTSNGSLTMTGGVVTNNSVLMVGVSTSNAASNGTTNGSFSISGGSWTNGTAGGTAYLQSVIVGANIARYTAATPTQTNLVQKPINGIATVSGSGSFRSYGNVYLGAGGGSGTLEIQSGSVVISNSGSAILQLGAAGTALGNTASGTDNAKGAITTVGNGVLNLSGGALTVDRLQTTAGNSSIAFTGGTLSVGSSAAVNLSGALAVGNGVLAARLNLASGGDFAFNHGIKVAPNAILDGAGSLAGGVEIQFGGTLLVGGSGSTGTLAMALGSDVMLSGTSVFDIASPGFAAGTYDFLTGTGSNIAYGGVLSLNFSGGSFANGSSVKLFDFASQTPNSNFANLWVQGLVDGQSAVFDNATGIVTVVPEPSGIVPVILGSLVLAGFRFAKRKQRLALA